VDEIEVLLIRQARLMARADAGLRSRAQFKLVTLAAGGRLAFTLPCASRCSSSSTSSAYRSSTSSAFR
jgi:hypothetical protein